MGSVDEQMIPDVTGRMLKKRKRTIRQKPKNALEKKKTTNLAEREVKKIKLKMFES